MRKENSTGKVRLQSLDLEDLTHISGGALTEAKEELMDQELYLLQKKIGPNQSVLDYVNNNYDKTGFAEKGISLSDVRTFANDDYA